MTDFITDKMFRDLSFTHKRLNLFKYIGAFVIILSAIPSLAGEIKPMDTAKSAMLNATRFMVDNVSVNGGYVRLYLPDLSRRWGELELYKTQVQVQDPGITSMGNLFLDAY